MKCLKKNLDLILRWLIASFFLLKKKKTTTFIWLQGISSCGMWDLVPWPGIDSGPPTWERRVLASRPPGKSQIHCLLNIVVVTSPLDHEDLIHHCFIHLCVPILYNSESTHTHTGHLLIIVASISIYWVWRQWYPTPVLLPGKSRGWRSLVGCSPWGR